MRLIRDGCQVTSKTAASYRSLVTFVVVVVFFFLTYEERCQKWDSHPDITAMVDWALKTSLAYLSIYLMRASSQVTAPWSEMEIWLVLILKIYPFNCPSPSKLNESQFMNLAGLITSRRAPGQSVRSPVHTLECLSVKLCMSHNLQEKILRLVNWATSSCSFTPTETVRLIRDGEPRTATSTFTQLLSSVNWATISPATSNNIM